LDAELAATWDVLKGYSGRDTDLGIARRYGGAAAAYSLRDIGAMNGRVVKVRREQDTTPADFSAGAIASGGLEQFAIGQTVLDLYNNASYSNDRENDFWGRNPSSDAEIDLGSGACSWSCDFVLTTDTFSSTTTRLCSSYDSSEHFYFSSATQFRWKNPSASNTTSISLDVTIQKNRKYNIEWIRDASDVVTIKIDGVLQSNSNSGDRNSGQIEIGRIGGFRLGGTAFNYNFNNGQHIYAGDGNTTSNWLDTGSGTTKNLNKFGSPVLFTGQGISAFIDTWYDQSGNGKDISQSTSADQPSIIVNGSLITSANGLPSISFADDAVTLERTEFLSGQLSAYFLVYDSEAADSGEAQVLLRQGSNYRIAASVLTSGKIRGQLRDGGGDAVFADSGGDLATGGTILQSIFIRARGAGGLYNYAQGANEIIKDTTDIEDVSFAASDTGDFSIGGNPGGAFDFKGEIQEAIFFESDLFTDKSTIETELNNHYNAF
jgi:hypothetical protein